ncbi:MAG: hypothetical protein HGJ94_06510 [Desulfosarcina sp.]|nr:hypothetical protein [Desulfosarcina sp.]
MAFYRYRITPRSGFATPLRSDTLYGHLLWAAAMGQGETGVTSLIESFADGAPAFVLSSAFPAGFFPMPALPAIPRTRFKSEFAGKGDLFDKLQQYKMFRKRKFWPVQLWQSLQGKISQETLFGDWLSKEEARRNSSRKDERLEPITEAYQPHVSIDRQSGSVLDQGGLFFSKGYWYRPGVDLDLYVQTEDRDAFETLLQHLEAVGYGADRSTGMGQFSFSRDESFDTAPFNGEGTHRLSLSVCAAPDLAGFEGYWIPMVKHGRAWSGFGEPNPFKKPFFAFTEGSLFRRMPDTGYLLRNIHSDQRIVQIGWPLTIPVTLEGHHAD